MKLRALTLSLLPAMLAATAAFAQHDGNPLDTQHQPGFQQPGQTPQHHQQQIVQQPAGDTIVFERVALNDPGMDNMTSHHLLKPKGWVVEGGAFWRPQVYQDFVRTSIRVKAGDGRELSIYPGGNFVYTNHWAIKKQRGDVMLQEPPGPGDITSNGFLFLPVPSSVSEYVANIVIPSNRPNAYNLQVLGSVELPELHAQIEAALVPMRRQAEQNNQQLRQMGAAKQTQMSAVAERVRVSYEEDGQLFEEDVWVLGAVIYNATQYTGQNYVEEWYDWRMIDPRGVRAPAGQLEQARPLLEAIALSVTEDPRYAAVLMHVRHKINMQEIETASRIAEISRQGREEAWNIYQSGVREQQASNDRMNSSFIDYVRDVDDFHDTDGSKVNLPSLYSYVYSNGNGEYILTNEPTLDPNDGSYDRWERINPAR